MLFLFPSLGVEITRILLENGEIDEWGDLFGMYAPEYIRNDDIGVLFKQHGFSLDETRNFEQKKNSNKGRLFRFQQIKEKRKQQLLTNIHQVHPELFYLKSAQNSNFAYHQQQLTMNRSQVLQEKRTRVSDRSTKDLPMLISLDRTTTSGQLDANYYIIYDPALRDDTKLPKITIFSIEPEYRWTESYPIESHRPPNYTRPDLQVSNDAPKPRIF